MVRYNTFYDTYTDMEKTLKGKITWLTEKDFSFLKSLYDYKVKSEHKNEAIQKVFIKFLKHFKIKSFRAYRKIQIEPKIFRKNLRVLFYIMPLTRREYLKAIKKLVENGKIKRVKLNNGGRERYHYQLK